MCQAQLTPPKLKNDSKANLSAIAMRPAIRYDISVHKLHAHLFGITLTIAQPAAQQVVSLPVWIAGSYLVREFSKNLQNLQAHQGKRTVNITQQDKCTWQMDCVANKAVTLTYEVYAFDNSVRTAWLDAQRGFFNGTSVCLRVHGQEAVPHQLTISPDHTPDSWQVATALPPHKTDVDGFGSYVAVDYDELVDSPVEMGTFWRGSFKAAGVEHQFVVAGAPASFDGARLLADTHAICEAEIAFWHRQTDSHQNATPHKSYLFMLNAVDNGYGGLEHRASTALICKRADLPRRGQTRTLAANDGYTNLLGLISHEYFHTWNVKQLRPAEFAHCDYSRENYTELLWFFEGFTSYFDDLLLRRAGIIDDATYLTLLCKTINQVQQTPGRLVQTVAQSSFDAWVKYYRQDENTANATVSYYTKGSLVALCLDLSLRQQGQSTLDDVMRGLWQRCQGGPMTQDDLLAVVQTLSGQSYAQQIATWVHSTEDLPLKDLLQTHGVQWREETAPMPDQLGLRVADQHGTLVVKNVLRDGLAEHAGLAAGDEWLGIELGKAKSAQGWRIRKLEDLALYLGPATRFTALVSRDQRLLRLPMTWLKPAQQVRLTVSDAKRVGQWLATEKLQKQ